MSAELRANSKKPSWAHPGRLIGGEMGKITVREIEKPIRVAEDEDILDILAENTTELVLSL